MGRRMKKALFRFRPFSKKQKQILTWYFPDSGKSDSNGIVADGAIRSGKTVSMALAFVIWAMDAFQDQNLAMCGKTIGSFRRNVLTVLKQMLLARGYSVTEHRADNMVEIGRGETVNYFYIFGGKDERSQDLIQGITLAGVLFDEVALMPQSFVNQATARCSVSGSKWWFNCNPAAPAHWFKKEWIDRREELRLLYLHFTMDDNLSLDEDIKERYRNMYTGVFYKRYILGQWVAAEGVIYDQFCNDPERFILEDAPPIMYGVIGVDFGGTGSAHSFTLTGFTKGFREIVVLDEYYYNNKERGRLSPAELDRAFVDFVRRCKSRFPVYEVYCDSAEQTLIEGLTIAAAKNRLGVEIKNAVKGPINERIAFYNSMMSQDRFRILRQCENTISALQNAVYSDKDPTKDERLDDGSVNVDSLDSMEYSTESIMEDVLYLSLKE